VISWVSHNASGWSGIKTMNAKSLKMNVKSMKHSKTMNVTLFHG
jgi:hypothetical protein